MCGIAVAVAAAAGCTGKAPTDNATVGPAELDGRFDVLVEGEGVTLELHPNRNPIWILAGSSGLEACPTDGAGEVSTDGPWSRFGFGSCSTLEKGDRTDLPVTDGNSHVPILVRPRGLGIQHFEFEVGYSRADPHVEVVAPLSGEYSISVRFNPEQSWIGVSQEEGLDLASKATIKVNQAGRPITEEVQCPAEQDALRCVGPVTVGLQAVVRLDGAGSEREPSPVYLQW